MKKYAQAGMVNGGTWKFWMPEEDKEEIATKAEQTTQDRAQDETEIEYKTRTRIPWIWQL